MNRKFVISAVLLGLVVVPGMAFAITNADELVSYVLGLINKIIPVLIAAMVLLLVVGAVQFATSADEEKRDKARKLMISTIIALAVIVLVWGLVNLIKNSLNLNTAVPTFPCVPAVPGGTC